MRLSFSSLFAGIIILLIVSCKSKNSPSVKSCNLETFLNDYVDSTVKPQDDNNSEKMALHLWQGGIGLPDRDFYFDTSARNKNIRAEYVKHLEKMFSLIGDDTAKAKVNATTVMRMETSLAEKSRKLEALRDPYKNYNKMSIDELSRITGSVDWKNLLKENGIASIDSVIAGQP